MIDPWVMNNSFNFRRSAAAICHKAVTSSTLSPGPRRRQADLNAPADALAPCEGGKAAAEKSTGTSCRSIFSNAA